MSAFTPRVLLSHGRYAFSGIVNRPKYEWPGGKKLAVYVAVNIEQFCFGQGLGGKIGGSPPNPKEPYILNFAWRDYGNRVGVWRLKSLLDELRWPASVLGNLAVYSDSPGVLEAFRDRGDEFVGHGVTNAERQGDWSEADEAAMIKYVASEVTRREGKAPTGWLGPWISQSHVTPDLLVEAGYKYTMDWACDDQPIAMKTRSGKPLVAVPYNHEVCDIPAILGQKTNHVDYANLIIDTFDEMLLQSKEQPLVMSIPLHPFIVGQPFRIRQLRRAFQHIQSVSDADGSVWITTAGNIVDHVLSLPNNVFPR